jgi:hypothetical protein
MDDLQELLATQALAPASVVEMMHTAAERLEVVG